VFENEPRVPEALFGLENVVLQRHQAGAKRETWQVMGRLVLDNLAAHFAGRPLPAAMT
jgi:hydroxypyruvate reductase